MDIDGRLPEIPGGVMIRDREAEGHPLYGEGTAAGVHH